MTTALILFLTSSLNAAPSISSVNGICSKGQSVTIYGSAFGSHPKESDTSLGYLPRYWDDFETGTVNTSVGHWDYGNSHAGVVMNTSNNRTGSTYCAEQVRGEAKNASLNHRGDASKTTLYLYCWRNFEPYNPAEATNFKTWRVYPSSVTNDFLFMIDNADRANLGTFYGIENSGGAQHQNDSDLGADAINSWHLYEIYISASPSTFHLWRDGRLICDAHDMTWGTWNAYRIVFDQYCNGTSRTDKTYTDDTYISFTQARVMIGDASTFSGSTHREIQIPTAWSDNSIIVNINQGSYTSGTTAYLYVVDANGDVNTNGYPITINQDDPDDNTAPAKPSGVSIQIVQ